MLNHITLRVSNFEKSREFFATALAPLGYKLLVEKQTSAGFGQQDAGNLDFWIKAGDAASMSKTKEQNARSFFCLAFTASSKQQVQEFYNAALAAGARDNGVPGYRTKYHPGYYAAFVLDPVDGYNIETVFDDPEKLHE